MDTPAVPIVPEVGAAPPGAAPIDVRLRVTDGVLQVLRGATASAVAGGILGVLVLGIGGRIVMRLAALFDPTSVGRFTENGNRIGTISAEGTLAVILFGGLFFGLFGGIVWIAVSPWIPGRGVRRAVLVMPVAMALSAFNLVEADNPDFQIIGNDPLVIAMLLGLVAIFGFALPLVDGWLDRRLPPASRTPRALGVVYAALVLMGAVLILPLAVGIYFSPSVCGCVEPPVPIGVALLVAGGATVAWWVARARGLDEPPPALHIVGRLAVLAAVGFGTLRTVEETGRILGG